MSRVRRSLVAAVTALAIAGGGAVTVVATPGTAQAAPASSKIANDHQRRLGQVRWWNAAKGFGYITYKVAGGLHRDLYTQWKWVEKPFGMEQGDIVSFIIGKGPKGQDVAVDVKQIGGA
ncbi:cold-shock protein [Streptomyces sp. NPDC090442]|uniref:cold-shock protein n=1 Tax=Streptomyces sp. NPDC090442 TaxID=3365962 RepID=UPI00380CCAB0